MSVRDGTGTIVEGLDQRKTVSITQASRLVSVHRRTIYNWIYDDKIQYVRTAGGAIRIFVDTLWRDGKEDFKL